MNKSNLALAAALVAVVIAIGCFMFLRPGKIFGAVSTTCAGFTTCYSDIYVTSVFGGTGALQTTGTATFGGLATVNAGLLRTTTNSTTTSASETLILADLNAYDTIILNPIVQSVTVTLPASSTVSTWLPTAGNSQQTCFINGTTTASVFLTFAGGTGTKLQVASSTATAVGSLNLGPQKEGCFTFTRANSTLTTFDIIAAYTAFL